MVSGFCKLSERAAFSCHANLLSGWFIYAVQQQQGRAATAAMVAMHADLLGEA